MESPQEQTAAHLLDRLRELADPARPEAADLDAATDFLRHEAVPYLELGGPLGLPAGAPDDLADVVDEVGALGRLADDAGPGGLRGDEHARAEALRRITRIQGRLDALFGDGGPAVAPGTASGGSGASGGNPAASTAGSGPSEGGTAGGGAHVASSDAPGSDSSGSDSSGSASEGFLARFRRSREMTPEEVRAFVESHSWAVLATSRDDAPYAVPIIYGFDGARFYSVSGPGTKASNIDDNGNVCLTITDVVEGGEWSSVVVMGQARWVESMAGRFAAVVALRKQRSIAIPATLQDALRLARARVLQLVPDAMTGRTTRPAD